MAYTACVLDKDSADALVAWLHENFEVGGFEVICHHMPVQMGPIADSMVAHREGHRHELRVVRAGRLDGVIAVEVDTVVPSKNARKHITLAVDRLNGWKPVQSNNIAEWKDIDPFTLWGVVQEC